MYCDFRRKGKINNCVKREQYLLHVKDTLVDFEKKSRLLPLQGSTHTHKVERDYISCNNFFSQSTINKYVLTKTFFGLDSQKNILQFKQTHLQCNQIKHCFNWYINIKCISRHKINLII